MSDHNDDFGAELAKAAAEIHQLAIVCRSVGIRKGPESREILVRIKRLMEDTAAMIAGEPTLGEIDAMTARYRAMAPLIVGLMNASGGQPQ